MNYTKGNWFFNGYCVENGSHVVAEINRIGDHWRDDAHLIAAAPEMYEACRALLKKTKEWTGTGKYQDLLLELLDIKEALAKAEGKE